MNSTISKRNGKGYSWRMIEETANGIRETSGFTIDNLDTKDFKSASSDYERVFITIRDSLEKHCESLSLDSREDRLQCTQVISDILRSKRVF
jgi:hypothetical protein